MLRMVTWSHDLAPTFSLKSTNTPLQLFPDAHCVLLDPPLESLPHFVIKISLGQGWGGGYLAILKQSILISIHLAMSKIK